MAICIAIQSNTQVYSAIYNYSLYTVLYTELYIRNNTQTQSYTEQCTALYTVEPVLSDHIWGLLR